MVGKLDEDREIERGRVRRDVRKRKKEKEIGALPAWLKRNFLTDETAHRGKDRVGERMYKVGQVMDMSNVSILGGAKSGVSKR
jgi:hypothetical protein